MITIDLVELGRMFTGNCDKSTPPEPSAFRCNTCLIVDGQEAILVDPAPARFDHP